MLLGAIALSAAGADPFPDRPGALSASQLKAAGEAASSVLGDRGILAASGKSQDGTPYAVFVMPAVQETGRVRRTTKTWCSISEDSWRCTPPAPEFRVAAGSLEHVFVTVDAALAESLVDFVGSPCFGAQIAAARLKPPLPPVRITAARIDTGRNGYQIFTIADEAGGTDNYFLRRASEAAPPCSFRVVDGSRAASAEAPATTVRQAPSLFAMVFDIALGLFLIIGAPLAAGALAMAYASRTTDPGEARRRGVWVTWVLGIVFGGAAGLVLDLLQSSMIPATLVFVIVQTVVSGAAALGVGRLCARRVRAA